jgi:hypothetical protein
MALASDIPNCDPEKFGRARAAQCLLLTLLLIYY